jgi:hypothetical protein
LRFSEYNDETIQKEDGLLLSADSYGQIDLQSRRRFFIFEVLETDPSLSFDVQHSQQRCANRFSGFRRKRGYLKYAALGAFDNLS